MVFSADVLTATSMVARIHNALYELAQAGTFTRHAWDGRKMAVAKGDAIQPSDFAANEESALVDESANTRTLARDYEQVSWEMRLGFPVGVTTEDFDCELMQNPPLIPATEEFGRQLTLNLVDVNWTHPPRGSSDTGSRVTYTFQVTPGRI